MIRKLSAIELCFFILPLAWGGIFSEGPWAWKWFCIYGLAFFLALQTLFEKTQKELRIDKADLILIALLVGAFICSIILNPKGAYEIQYLDWSCFALIAVATAASWCTESFQNILCINQLTTVALLLIALIESVFIPQGEPPGSTFGHQNMFAEYLGISLILQSYDLFFTRDKLDLN